MSRVETVRGSRRPAGEADPRESLSTANAGQAALDRAVTRFVTRHAAKQRALLDDPLVVAARLRWDPAYDRYQRRRMADAVVASASPSTGGAVGYAPLLRSTRYDGDPCRRIAASILVSQATAPTVDEDLISALRQEPDTEVRRSLVDALHVRRSERCTQAVWASYYFDPDAAVRQHAGRYCPRREAYRLDEIREMQARDVEVGAYFDTRLLLARGRDRLNWLSLKFFYETMRYAGPPTASELITLRNAAAESPRGASRAEAMAAFGRWAGYADREDGFVLGCLLALHDGSTDLAEQHALVQAFTRSGSPAALQPLIDYSAAADAGLRREALYGIGYIAGRHQEDTAADEVILESWRAVGRAVRRCLHTDSDPNVRRAAAQCIGLARSQAGMGDLAYAMRDPAVRNSAAGALAMLGSREALAWLVWRRGDSLTASDNFTPHAWLQDLLMFDAPRDTPS